MKNQIINNLVKDNNFLSSLILPEIQIALLWRGGPCGYVATRNGAILFEGTDYKPAPSQPTDSLEAIVGLLAFLTVKEGDTDREYFAGYTADQLAWARSADCERIGGLVGDFEDTNGEYYGVAAETFGNAFNAHERSESEQCAHTSGEWTRNGTTVIIPVRKGEAGAFHLHVYLQAREGEAIANAKLIAAAPDLLYALRNLANLSMDTARPTKAERQHAQDLAWRAIEKATK